MVLDGTSDLFFFAPGRKQIFTFLFFNSLANLNPAIMEFPTIKVVPFSRLIFRWIWWWIWYNGILNVAVIVAAIGIVIVVVAVAVLRLGGSDVATIIISINCLFYCFVVFNLIIVSSEENLFYFIYFWNEFFY